MAKAKTNAPTAEARLTEVLMPESEQPYVVPGNWVWTRLECINTYQGRSIDPSNAPDGLFELYSVPSCELDYPEIVMGMEIGSTKQSVNKDDVLLCKINPRINRVWIVSQHTENPLIASSEWIIVRNTSIYILYSLRTKRNIAVHEGYDSFEDCKILLEMAYTLSVWFMQTYGDYTYEPTGFVLPEEAVINGKQTALLAMATGTGKTRTVLGMIYRFLKTKRFKRILFLVDRTALGEQAQDVFKEVKIEDLMTLDEIYNIKNLDDKDIDRETKVHVATVQSLVKRVLYNEGDFVSTVTDYDIIIVDEAHRGYILDKEMGEDELLYRSQTDYMSKYRAVIEYFDAVKIALTATPALHTTEIFGKPVFEYSYRRAVIEGFLVDHDAPHNIRTMLREEGITYHMGETVPIYDPVTGEITNSDELEDELKFDIESFNRNVITEPFNRTVLTEIARELNPEGDGKTLIYAVDDNHADLIVKILKEIYEPMGVSNDAIMKITGSIGGGNPKKVLEAVKRFKNEKYPSILLCQ